MSAAASTPFQADGVRITILVENWVDMLLGDGSDYRRAGLVDHFDPKRTSPIAENGLSLFIEVFDAGRRFVVLFDCGLTADVLAHNLDALGLDARDIDHVAISHGHLDHHGGLAGLLELIGRPVPVAVHPEALLPRYAVMPTGGVAPYYNKPLLQRQLEDLGARFVLSRDPLPLAPGVLTTGEIPLQTPFEGPPDADVETKYRPGIYQLQDERIVPDLVLDEIGISVSVRGEGLVVVTGCGHAGVVNTVMRARELTGQEELALVMGGFHLGFPGTPDEKVDATVDALAALAPRRIVPMHCSGLRCIASVANQLPEAFMQYSVGTTVTVGEVPAA